MSSEIFMAEIVQIVVLWVVTSCSLVVDTGISRERAVSICEESVELYWQVSKKVVTQTRREGRGIGALSGSVQTVKMETSPFRTALLFFFPQDGI
jgi:hypothetical protein